MIELDNPTDSVEIEFLGLTLTIGVESYHVEDQGIGSYECHGFRGFHSDMVAEIDSLSVECDSLSQEQLDILKTLINDLYCAGKIEIQISNLD